MTSLSKNSGIWHWSMFSFILAGLTGFLFRFGFVEPLPMGLSFENLRHAHSHLMFFGWGSLLPLYLIKLHTLPGYHAALGAKLMRGALWWILMFTLLSYPPFLLYGYEPVVLAGSRIPLAAILSGMVMVGWYIFMAGYLVTRFKKKDFSPNAWFEGALFALAISSLGAWAVGILQFVPFGGPLLSKALTHFFLATFMEGWVLLVLLGFISISLKVKEDDYVVSPTILVGLIAIGAPLTFPYGISSSLISFDLSVAARMGGLLIAEGVLLFIYSAGISRWKELSIWKWPLLFLILKSILQVIASVSPVELWLSDHGIRILYLHVVLLGAYTTGICCYLSQIAEIQKSYFYFIVISVSFLILTLIPLTHLWPDFLNGVWVYEALMAGALLPVIAISLFWLKLAQRVHRDHLSKRTK